MRLLTASIATTVLAATFTVAPTVQLAARPGPVSPSIDRVTIPAVVGQSGGRGTPVVAALTKTGSRFDVAGVTFGSRPPQGLAVEARVHISGSWQQWKSLPVEDAAPDPGTLEARRARYGTAPLLAAGADGIEVRVTNPSGASVPGLAAELIDAGTSPAATPTALAGAAVAAATRPAIVTRADWGADESLRNCDPTPIAYMKAAVIHHTVNSNSYTESQAAGLVRGIYAYHTTGLGWCDIGYQFLVDRFGRIYEGRVGNLNGNTQGAQAAGVNGETFGVASIGDHTSTQATTAAQDAIVRVVAWKAAQNGFDPAGLSRLTSAGGGRWPAGQVVTLPSTVGHRDVGLTECPGDALYARVPSLRLAASDRYAADLASWTAMTPTKVEETFARPSGSTFTFSGRGYGHGRGMSQWGAYGAATKGLTWQQIVGFYYPGTSIASQGNPYLRIHLTALGSGGTTVPAQTGLTFSDGTHSLTLPTGPTQWRIVPDGAGVTLQWRSGSGWASSTYWKGWTTSPLRFLRPAGTVRVMLPTGNLRDYSGSVLTSPLGGAAVSVNLTGFEQYLRGVVPAEMPPSWSPAALQAQAVAARTYAAYERRTSTSALYDTCDTTSCQVYRGIADYTATGTLLSRWEDSRTTAAVSATGWKVLNYGGVQAFTQFSASNGGRTVAGTQPYLVAKNDPYDGVVVSASNPNQWKADISIASIEKAYPAVGSLRSIVVTGRSGGGLWSGRTTGVRVVGTSGTTTVSADTFRFALGLKSTWWTGWSTPPRSAPTFPRDLTADSLGDALVPVGGQLVALAYSGNMSFASRSLVSSGWTGLRLTAGVGPWDRDNLGDVIAATSDGALWLYPGNAVSTLDRPRVRIGSGWGAVNLIVPSGDFSGDGYTDFLARRTDSRLFLYRGDGTGAIVGAQAVGNGWHVFSRIVPGDFDGNGTTDVLAIGASDGRMYFYSGTGTGSLRSGQPVGTTDWRFISQMKSVGDLTGDGRADLLVRRAADGALRVYPVTGTASIGTPVPAGTYASTASWAE